VEAVDDLGLDRLNEGLEGDVGLPRARRSAVGEDDAIVFGKAILGLHEPAGRVDAEDVQRVLDTAANEPAVTMERGRGEECRGTGEGGHHVCTGPFRTAVTGVD